MFEPDSDDLDDGNEVCEFPEVTDFKSFEKEAIKKSRSKPLYLEEARDWLTFRGCSPVLDAWARWNNNTAIEEEELCSFLNMSPSSASLKLVKLYLSGSTISIGVEELKDVLEISDMLFLDDLVNYCKYRIQNIELNEENFMQILEVCSLYDFVHPHMLDFVISHLPLLTDMEGSEALTYDTVVSLLTEDVLTYWTMEERFNFITKWCKACISRVSLFSGLFELIDLSFLEQDFINSVVKTENLVRGSNKCLHRVDDAFQHRMTCKPTPAVLIGDTHSNEIFVFNSKNRRSGYITVPINTPSVSVLAWTVLLPDYIILITRDNKTNVREVVKYHMHTQKTESKYMYSYLEGKGVRIDNITQFLWNDDTSFFIGKSKCPVTDKRLLVPFCTVYIKDKELPDTVLFLPLMSFKFDITQICVFKSFLLVRSHSDDHLYCFNWTIYKLTNTTIPQDMHSASPPSLLTLLPIHDTIYAVYQSYIIQWTFDISTAEMTSVRKFYVDIGSDPFVTIATAEDALIRVDDEFIHVCESIQHLSLWKSHEHSDIIAFRPNSIVTCVFLRKNVDLCHLDCPHCKMCPVLIEDMYTDFGEPYQTELLLREEYAKRERMYFEVDYDFYSDYDDELDYDDDYFDDRPVMIYLTSPDEWVEWNNFE